MNRVKRFAIIALLGLLAAMAQPVGGYAAPHAMHTAGGVGDSPIMP